jgi:four helix bundle protein
MAQYNHLPIFQLTYQLTLEIHRATHQFPREYKYTLGQKLKEIVSDVLDMIVEANSAEEKTEILEGARLKLERLRIHLRLANDLEILGLKRYEAFNRTLEEISKQLSGWLEWSKSKKSGSLKTG